MLIPFPLSSLSLPPWEYRKEFEEHGLNGITTLECRDVCKEGFNLEGKVDAIFLDLPAPWEAIASAKKALDPRKMGRICCFSPCIEQVQRTRQVLNQEGFTGEWREREREKEMPFLPIFPSPLFNSFYYDHRDPNVRIPFQEL